MTDLRDMLWSDHLTAEEFQVLISPKKINFLEAHQIFFNIELVSKLQQEPCL